MKQITAILLLSIGLLSAKCQSPDTIICYDEADMQAQKLLLLDTIEYFEGLITFKDSIINNTLDAYQANRDTFNYTIRGINDLIEIVIDKRGEDISFDFVDGDIDRRFHFYYSNKQRSIQMGDSLKATPPWLLDWK